MWKTLILKILHYIIHLIDPTLERINKIASDKRIKGTKNIERT